MSKHPEQKSDGNGDGGNDRLASINDDLRKLSSAQLQATPWLPLESNPLVLNAFAHRVGLPSGWDFIDVPSLDLEVLPFFLPNPVAAFVLLFPCTANIYRFRREEEKRTRAHAEASGKDPCTGVFFLQQHASFGNACGSIASVHVLSNLHHRADGAVRLHDAKPMATFVDQNSSKSPNDRGTALFNDTTLKESSDTAASDGRAQTPCPNRDGPDLDHHFTAFVLGPGPNAQVLELDGTKWAPIEHGASTPDTFVRDVTRVVKTNFMDIQPDSIQFNLVALMQSSK